MEGLWHKNAIVYTVDVQSFADGNGDGVGDFRGLARKLDYLSGLNVNCLWLQPFYPSPFRDHGYDISDYYGIDPRYGTLGDFVEFSQAARDRGIRVIADLVVNHTSIDHWWFQEARRDKRSKYRNWYVWSKEKPPDAEQGMAFPGVQKTTWTFDETAGEYYYHRFYNHQPDLNTGNPEVRGEIEKIIKTWLQLGVSGFRVDALPFTISTKGPGSQAFGDHPEYLVEMRQVLSWGRGDAVFMAEANYERILISATTVIVPALVLAEVDCFLRAERKAMRRLIAEILDPATRYEYELPLPTDIARALELDAKFHDLDLGLVDGTVAAVAERRRVYRVLTSDRRDFSAIRVGPRLKRALDLLP